MLTWNKDALDCAEYICLRWRVVKTVSDVSTRYTLVSRGPLESAPLTGRRIAIPR
jgi:hypothetical protein